MNPRICVVGLGYVGLPVALAFSEHFGVVGFDVNAEKIERLKRGEDPTGDCPNLSNTTVQFTGDPAAIKNANFIVIAVPTPITADKVPDLSFVKSAGEIVGQNLQAGSIVVLESTVYPGVTEEVLAPLLESNSGLKCGTGFKVGYSPERINPGDAEHSIDRITKVVSGCDTQAIEEIARVYGMICKAGVYKAKTIRAAEAAKVIENVQRDLNIALVNELALIFNRAGIDTKDVLEAAGTKWNFHKYTPGLVGGHCIGVDPYYLTHFAEKLGHNPEVILAGRRLNDSMALHVAGLTAQALTEADKTVKDANVLVLGLTFKENVNDTRNSKAKDVIAELKRLGAHVVGYDPLLSAGEIKSFGIAATDFSNGNFDAIVYLVPHDAFGLTLEKVKQASTGTPVLIDVKSSFSREDAEKKGIQYKSL